MNDTIRFILSLSIAIAAIMGMVRYRKMDPSYHPFVYYTWFVLLFEVVVYLLNLQKAYSTLGILFNVYAFAEFWLLTWVFHKWGLFRANTKSFYLILVTFFLACLFSTLFTKGIYKRNHYFAITYSFALIFFSIAAFNKLVVQERRELYKNAKFWICIGIVIFFSYFVISSGVRILIIPNNKNQDFFVRLMDINVYSNLLVNLLYAIALLWIPNKKNFLTL
jgi:hypothetical protein